MCLYHVLPHVDVFGSIHFLLLLLQRLHQVGQQVLGRVLLGHEVVGQSVPGIVPRADTVLVLPGRGSDPVERSDAAVDAPTPQQEDREVLVRPYS